MTNKQSKTLADRYGSSNSSETGDPREGGHQAALQEQYQGQEAQGLMSTDLKLIPYLDEGESAQRTVCIEEGAVISS